MEAAEEFRIEEIEQLRAIADPLRQRILRALCCRPATTKQIAPLLGEKPSRLYHHVELLEKAGLIRLVETRQNRGTLEKYYLTVAKHFDVDRELLRNEDVASGALSEMRDMLVDALEASLGTPADALARPQADAALVGNTVLTHVCCRLSETQARQVAEHIRGWLRECESMGQPEGEETYALAIAFFPIRGGSEELLARCCDPTGVCHAVQKPDRE